MNEIRLVWDKMPYEELVQSVKYARNLNRKYFKEIERLNNIIETTKIFVEKYNDKPFDIEVREMILKCLNDEVKRSDKE